MTPTDAPHAIAALCIGGDWACAHGDFAGLRDVARQLGSYVPDFLQGKLAAVIDACRRDLDHATELWVEVAQGARSVAIVRA